MPEARARLEFGIHLKSGKCRTNLKTTPQHDCSSVEQDAKP